MKPLNIFIPTEATLLGVDWLGIGYRLWRNLAPKTRDNFLPRMTQDMTGYTNKLASPSDFSSMMAKVLTEIRVPVSVEMSPFTPGWPQRKVMTGEERFLTATMASAWTGHSERASRSSLAALLGFPKKKGTTWGGGLQWARTSTCGFTGPSCEELSR